MSTIELRRQPTTAEEWAARMHAADVSERDRAEFYAWISADPSNADAYAECDSLWFVSRRLRGEPKAAAQITTPRMHFRWAIAAGIAALASAVALIAPHYPSGDRTETVTRKGEQRVIALEDGSSIQLNTDTLVSYRLNERERRVELERGEAFFDVTPDAARPFIVRAGKTEVRVMGTQFTVRQEADRLEVIVKEGKVNVVPDAGAFILNSQRVELTRGSKLRLEPEQHRMKVAMVDPDRAMAWRSGSLDFEASRLEDVVAELNRYAQTPFAIEDDSIRGIPVTGRVRVNDLDSIRYMLRESFRIESVTRANSIALRSIAR